MNSTLGKFSGGLAYCYLKDLEKIELKAFVAAY
jgi:hypothetical protein